MPAPPAAPLRRVAAVVAAGVLVPAAAAQTPPPVTVGQASVETIEEVDLAAERPGVLRAVPFREGDRVETDAVVAELWDEVPRAQIRTLDVQAEDTISEEYALKAAQVARAELRSILNANNDKAGVVPAADVERAKLSFEQARAQIEKARLDREIAGLRAEELRAELQSYSVAAPFEGVVQRVLKLPGAAVRQGEPILRLVNPDRLRVVAQVPLEQVVTIRVGDLATGVVMFGSPSVPAPVPPLAGKVTFIDPISAEGEKGRVRVFVEVPNPTGLLRAGMQAAVTIQPGTAPVPPVDPGQAPEAAGDLLGDAAANAGLPARRTARFRPPAAADAAAGDMPHARTYVVPAADPFAADGK